MLSSAVQMQDYNQRRAFVYHTLVEHANASQSGVRCRSGPFWHRIQALLPGERSGSLGWPAAKSLAASPARG